MKTLQYIDRISDSNSNVWSGAKFVNKAFRMGLMDPDAFIQKYDQGSAKMDAGRVVCQLAQWLTDKSNADLAKSGVKNAGYVSIPWSGAVFAGANYSPVGLASYWSIASTCKKPDRAMDVINYFFSEEGSRNMLSGVKGKYWTVKNGKAALTVLGSKAKADPDFMTKTGIRKFQNLTGIDQQAKDSNGQYVDLFLEPDVQAKTLSPVKKDWLKNYGATSEDLLWKKLGGFSYNSAFDALMPQPSTDDLRVQSKIDTYLLSNLPKVWMAKDDAEYDAAKAEIISEIKKFDGYNDYVKNTKKAIEFTAKIVNSDFN